MVCGRLGDPSDRRAWVLTLDRSQQTGAAQNCPKRLQMHHQNPFRDGRARRALGIALHVSTARFVAIEISATGFSHTDIIAARDPGAEASRSLVCLFLALVEVSYLGNECADFNF